MWNPHPFIWSSENYILKIGKDYEMFLDSIMFVRLQIFIADFIFFVPQSSIPIIESSEEDEVYESIARKLTSSITPQSLEYLLSYL